MAKTLKETQAAQLREELGMSTEAVPVRKAERREQIRFDSNADVNAGTRMEEERERPSLWEITKASAQVDNTAALLFRDEAPDAPIDLDFKGSEYWKSQKARLDAMPGIDLEEVMADVVSASSAEEAEHWLSQHEKNYENEVLLTNAGMKALLPRLAISILDPVDWTVAAATGGIGGAAVKANKWGKIATAAASSAAGVGATEALLASQNSMRDETDVMFAVALGAGMGGGITSLLVRKEARDLQKLKNAIVDDIGDGVDSAGAARRASEQVEPEQGLAKKSYDDVQEMLEGTDDVEFGLGWLTKPFRTLHSNWLYSPSQQVRKIGSRLLEGGFLKDKTKTRSATAEGAANVIRRRFEAGVFRESLPGFKAWAKENGVGSVRRAWGTDAGEQFYSQVGRALRGEVADDISSHAQQAAKAMRKHLDEIYNRAQMAGVKGFERGALENYFPRMIKKSKFEEMRRTYGDGALADWFARNLENANDIDPDLAQKIGRAYVRTMAQKIAGIETDLLSGIRLDDIDELRAILRDDAGNLSSEAEELLAELEARKLKEMGERGSVSFGKKRIQFDESAAYPIKQSEANGGAVDNLKFHTMFENDARRVLKRYGQIMSGHIGVAEQLGIKSRREWEMMEEAIVHEGDQLGRQVEAQKEIKALRTGYDLLVGKNSVDPNPTGDLSQALRTATAYTYSTRGGQFGVNALAEMGNIIGAAGVRAFLRSIPEWKSMMTRAANGELEHDLARNLELLFAPGINSLTGVAIRNFDDFGEAVGGRSVTQRVAGALDKPLTVAGRATSIMSGLNTITDVTGRVAAVEMLRKMARFANGRKISKGQEARLRNMGISPQMQERIFAMLRKGDNSAGVYRKGRLIDLKPEKWTDSEALEAFSQALNRETRSIIQENDLGTVTKYFHHPVGKVIFQFMRFPMEAVQKQLGRGIHFHDAETVKSWLGSFFIGATVYMAQQSIEYANNPEELKKRLDPVNVGKVGFMRTGFSSMLPAMIDFPLAFTPMGKQFELGRSSGLTTGSYLSNPVAATVDAGLRAGTNISKSIMSDEQQIARQDIKDLSKLMPGYRFLGMSNAINWVAEAFPESRKE